MDLIFDRVPTYKAGEDLGVFHRVKKPTGVKTTEIWTLRDFPARTLLLAPWSPEMKERGYTQHTSVHLKTKDGVLPWNRVLALDGRSRSHLAHEDKERNTPSSTGGLFWAVDRTTDLDKANLFLEWAEVFSDVPYPSGIPDTSIVIV